MTPSPSVAERYAGVRARIAAAAARADRHESEITLLGASKLQTPETIGAGLCAGLRTLGENYVQEAAGKQPAIADFVRAHDLPAPRWHMIGALQRNKARLAVSLFDVIETVDRPSLASELDKRARALEKRIEVYLQVNLSHEPQKAGVEEAELPALLEHCACLDRIDVVGLMTIPAPVPDPADNRPVFARLREWRDRLRQTPAGEHLAGLSMGMSRDFEIAIEEGATVVRVGSDLFGPRSAKRAPGGNLDEDEHP